MHAAGRALAVALLKLSPPWAASCDVQLLAVAIGMAQLSPKASTLASQTTKQGDGAGDPFALLLLFTWRITWQLPTNQLARWCARCVPPRPIRTFGFRRGLMKRCNRGLDLGDDDRFHDLQHDARIINDHARRIRWSGRNLLRDPEMIRLYPHIHNPAAW